jgi:hypothetical protein
MQRSAAERERGTFTPQFFADSAAIAAARG